MAEPLVASKAAAPVREESGFSAEELRARFSDALVRALNNRYKRTPSAAQLARDFSMLIHCRQPISRETARKWLHGLGFPDVENLALLVNWLDLNLDEIFRAPKSNTANSDRSLVRSADHSVFDASLAHALDDLSEPKKRIVMNLIQQLASP